MHVADWIKNIYMLLIGLKEWKEWNFLSVRSVTWYFTLLLEITSQLNKSVMIVSQVFEASTSRISKEWPYENFWKFLQAFVRRIIWDKVFKNEPSEICGRQPLKNLKWYGLLKQSSRIFSKLHGLISLWIKYFFTINGGLFSDNVCC